MTSYNLNFFKLKKLIAKKYTLYQQNQQQQQQQQ